MTTGQYLASLSGLSSGSALTHLMAIQTGGGSGETIFTSKIHVVSGQDTLIVSRKAKRQAPQDQPCELHISNNQSGNKKAVAFIFLPVSRIEAFTASDEITVLQRNEVSTITTTQEQTVVQRRNKE